MKTLEIESPKSDIPNLASVQLPQIPADSGGVYEFADVFGNDRPVELELGVGKGRFLIQQAETRPDTNFVGVEWASRYYRLVCERAAKRGLCNLRMLRDDAGRVVRETLPEGSIAALHVYFPDPWPKARHHKRRLIQPPFARWCAKALRAGGAVRLATDHADYAGQMQAVFDAAPDFERVFMAVGDEAPVGVTNWEVKFRREGRVIHKYEYRRRPGG